MEEENHEDDDRRDLLTRNGSVIGRSLHVKNTLRLLATKGRWKVIFLRYLIYLSQVFGLFSNYSCFSHFLRRKKNHEAFEKLFEDVSTWVRWGWVPLAEILKIHCKVCDNILEGLKSDNMKAPVPRKTFREKVSPLCRIFLNSFIFSSHFSRNFLFASCFCNCKKKISTKLKLFCLLLWLSQNYYYNLDCLFK